MKLSARPLLLCSVAASGALMLGACGKHDDTASKPAPATSSTAPATPMIPATPASSVAPPGTASSTPVPPGSTMAPMTPAPASTSASVAAPADAAFAVSKVTVGDAVGATHKVSAAKNDIAANEKSIYASVETSGKTRGATLSARWSYLEGKGQLVSAISQSIATEGPAVTTFKIQNPHTWPEGKYKVEIALDGRPVSSQAFEIKSS